jgi:hypothetical protein
MFDVAWGNAWLESQTKNNPSWPGLTRPPRLSRGSAMESQIHHEDTKNTKLHEALCDASCPSWLRGEKRVSMRTDARVLGGRVKLGHDEFWGRCRRGA